MIEKIKNKIKIRPHLFFLAMSSIKMKKKRTYLTLTAVALSTCVIFSSLILIKNIYAFSQNHQDRENGNYHYVFQSAMALPSFPEYLLTVDQNTNYYGTLQGKTINLRSLFLLSEERTVLPFVLENGRFAVNESEIVISDQWPYALGDVLTLELYKAEDNSAELLYGKPELLEGTPTQFSFTVVGIYHYGEQMSKLSSDMDLCYTILPSNGNMICYARDKNILSEDAADVFKLRMQLDKQNLFFTNDKVITNDCIRAYLLDPTNVMMLLGLVILLSAAISLISIHNTLLVGDHSRRKEIGLFKSIGAAPSQIEVILKTEMIFLGVTGSFAGILLGMLLSGMILSLLIDKIYVTFYISMLLDWRIILLSLLTGVLMMYFCGKKTYQNMINSTPIEDLSQTHIPLKLNDSQIIHDKHSFQWKMFLMYDRRQIKQTLNIRYSLCALLFCSTIFMGVFLSNMVYKNQYATSEYDITLSNTAPVKNSLSAVNEPSRQLATQLYRMREEGIIDAKEMITERFVSSDSFGKYYMSREDVINSPISLSYVNETSYALQDEGSLYRLGYVLTLLDEKQISALEPYLVYGSLDHLTSHDLIIIECKNQMTNMDMSYFDDCHIYRDTGHYHYVNDMKIAAYVILPDQLPEDGLYMDYTHYNYLMALSFENVELNDITKDSITEHIYITLNDPSSSVGAQEAIETALSATKSKDIYQYTNITLAVKTSQFTAFLIEALFYPLFFMLFIVSITNIYHVFLGDIHLKSRDIGIMKSIGMTNRQMLKMLLYEYLEGYFNASLLTLILFLPTVGLFALTADIFQLAAHMFSTLLLSICCFDILLMIPLFRISAIHMMRITPVDNLKETF